MVFRYSRFNINELFFKIRSMGRECKIINEFISKEDRVNERVYGI